MKKIKIDLHSHTTSSLDSSIKIEELYDLCKKLGISKIAITDHNEIKGALKLKKMHPDFVIVGEEIMTNKGEIIGLFLKEFIKPRMSPEETIKEIRKQGGVVYIPHPFDPIRPNIGAYIDKIKDDIDIIEVFNSKIVFKSSNTKARKYAKKNKLLMGAGSDAHAAFQLGRTYILMDDFDTKEEFLKNLKDSKIVGVRTTYKEFIKMGVYYVKNLIKNLFKKKNS
jgi:predicted metal-dependent phosphoesterase TrpH